LLTALALGPEDLAYLPPLRLPKVNFVEADPPFEFAMLVYLMFYF
jgi:hypothetical protein